MHQQITCYHGMDEFTGIDQKLNRELTCSKIVSLPLPRLMRLRKLYEIGGA